MTETSYTPSPLWGEGWGEGPGLNRLSENCHSEASAEESCSLADCYYEILRFTQNDNINIL